MRLNRIVEGDHRSDGGQPALRDDAVDRFVDEGRLVEAVDALVERRRADPGSVDLSRLRELRHQAALAHVAGEGRTAWPPDYDDPFPTAVGEVVSVDRGDLTTEVVGGAIAHHGCVVVRGAYDADQVARTVALIDAAHEARLEGRTADPYDPLKTPPMMMNQVLRTMVGEQGGIWLGDSPAATEQVLDDLRDAGITSVIEEHLGERPFFSLQKSTLRRSVPVFKPTGWHQDGSFLGEGVRTMNCWVALTACGGDRPAPGLEVVPRRMHELLPVGDGFTQNSILDEVVAEVARATPTLVPEFSPGDALLFDERFLHRTHLDPAMTEDRYALEC